MQRDDGKLDLYLTHRSALVEYARPIVGSRSQAEDVVQEAYLRFNGATHDEPLREPVGFLFRIVRNLAVDFSRRITRESRMMEQTDASEVAADRPSPEAEAVHRDQLRLVMDALSELPDRTRIAVEMHRIEGRTMQDIADHLGISPAWAHKLIYDGLDHCRRRLRRRAGPRTRP